MFKSNELKVLRKIKSEIISIQSKYIEQLSVHFLLLIEKLTEEIMKEDYQGSIKVALDWLVHIRQGILKR